MTTTTTDPALLASSQAAPETGLRLPWLPDGRTVLLPGRGETYARIHRHPDASRLTVLMLHGWTASADLQFFTAYRQVCQHYSLVAIDHRGHGRGLRSATPFQLEDVADIFIGVFVIGGIGALRSR